jgi:hypothetical protein
MRPPKGEELQTVLSGGRRDRGVAVLERIDPAVAADAFLRLPFEEQKTRSWCLISDSGPVGNLPSCRELAGALTAIEHALQGAFSSVASVPRPSRNDSRPAILYATFVSVRYLLDNHSPGSIIDHTLSPSGIRTQLGKG